MKKSELSKLAKSGTVARTALACFSRPKGLTLEDIAEISGLTPGNVRNNGVPPLIKAQVIKRQKTPQGKLFKLVRG